MTEESIRAVVTTHFASFFGSVFPEAALTKEQHEVDNDQFDVVSISLSEGLQLTFIQLFIFSTGQLDLALQHCVFPHNHRYNFRDHPTWTARSLVTIPTKGMILSYDMCDPTCIASVESEIDQFVAANRIPKHTVPDG